LSSAAAESKAVLLDELERVLRERRLRGEIAALVVDEAHCLSNELLEEVRLLGNIETATEKLLPLVLAGQPELGTRLEEPGLRQLKQRVGLRCEIAPFELRETAAYIASRIRMAGGTPSAIFTQEAVTTIHEFSGGIARTVNVICDNALVSGVALERSPVDRTIVLDVCRDFSLHGRNGSMPFTSSHVDADYGDVVMPRAAADAWSARLDEPVAHQLAHAPARPRRFTLFGSRHLR
jgi:type II secretory pathway predicted ATPase ExeA